jgi:hypothetical protein
MDYLTNFFSSNKSTKTEPMTDLSKSITPKLLLQVLNADTNFELLTQLMTDVSFIDSIQNNTDIINLLSYHNKEEIDNNINILASNIQTLSNIPVSFEEQRIALTNEINILKDKLDNKLLQNQMSKSEENEWYRLSEMIDRNEKITNEKINILLNNYKNNTPTSYSEEQYKNINEQIANILQSQQLINSNLENKLLSMVNSAIENNNIGMRIFIENKLSESNKKINDQLATILQNMPKQTPSINYNMATNRPTNRPTTQITSRPTNRPTTQTTSRPTNRPTMTLTSRPTNRPTMTFPNTPRPNLSFFNS